MNWKVTRRNFENTPLETLGLDANQLKAAYRLPHKLTVDTTDGKTIAGVCDNVDYANLIAAAPALLEACKDAASNGAIQTPGSLLKLFNAIAKAEGE